MDPELPSRLAEARPEDLDASTALPRVAARIFGAPLLMEPARFEAIVGALAPRLAGEKFEARADAGDKRPRDKLTVIDGVAVIPVMGPLVHRYDWLSAACGMTSYEQINAQLSEALDSPLVDAVLLDVDSPGGEVSGCFDLADLIHAARATKPVWAVATGTAASAAYALGSAAERVYVAQTAVVGSIGVIMAHRDQSAKNAKDGVKYTSIYAGARKADGSPHEPLSPEAQASAQALVDDIYGIFVSSVARNRGLPAEQVRATEAGVFVGARAVDAGLADGIATPDQVLAMLRQHAASAAANPLHLNLNQERTTMSNNETAAPPADNSAAIASATRQAEEKERSRSSAILKAAAGLRAPVELAQRLINEGVTVEAAVEQLSDHAAKASPAAGINAARGEDGPADDLPVAEAAAREWDADPKLRNEFSAKENYVAYRAAVAGGLVKVETKRKQTR